MGFVPFPKGISSKVNIIAPLQFELAYYDGAVPQVSHYTSGIPFPLFILGFIYWDIVQISNGKIKSHQHHV